MPFVYRWSYPLLSCSPGRLGRTVMPRHFVRPLSSAPALPLDQGVVTLALEDELACLPGIDATSEHEQQPARAIPTLTEPVELVQRRAFSFVWFRLNRKRSR